MADSKIPSQPRLPHGVDWQAKDTEPPPDTTVEIMRELRGALVNVSDLVTRLDYRLCQTMLALAAKECQTQANKRRIAEQAAAILDLNERLQVLEGMAAE